MSVGIDIVSVKRVEELIGRFGERFLKKVLPEGWNYCIEKRKGELPGCIAARFALKEAAVKALSRAGYRVKLKDVKVRGGGERLSLEVTGTPPEVKLLFSISHEKEFAVAVVNVISSQSSP